MKEELFTELLESVRKDGAILRDEKNAVSEIYFSRTGSAKDSA